MFGCCGKTKVGHRLEGDPPFLFRGCPAQQDLAQIDHCSVVFFGMRRNIGQLFLAQDAAFIGFYRRDLHGNRMYTGFNLYTIKLAAVAAV